MDVYVAVVAPAGIVIPIGLGISRYGDLSTELRVIVWYLLLAAITNIVGNTLAFYSVNNMAVMHVYTVFEFALLGVFYKILLGNDGSGQIVKWLIPGFLFLCIANFFFFQRLSTYNTVTKSVEALCVIFMAVAYFKKMLDNLSQGGAGKNALAYVNTALLLYFSGSFILFVIPNEVLQNFDFYRTRWKIHATLLLIMYLLFAVALWEHKK